jgi:hypothetical protein
MSIRYADPLAGFEDRATAEIVLAPELVAKSEKIAKRREQRNGNRALTGNPRGRPKLTEAEAAESKQRQKANHREWMRGKRAMDRFAGDSKNGAPSS